MKKLISLLSFICLFILSITDLRAQTVAPIEHYTGHYFDNFDSRGMQITPEQRETWYVHPNGDTVVISIPSYSATSPHNYFRWYDYTTDLRCDHISITYGTWHNVYPNGHAQSMDGTYAANFLGEVNYAISQSVLPEVIACDVSAHTDFLINTEGYVTREPTLSYRYIAEIRDGNELAQRLETVTQNGEYLENVTVSMPMSPESTSNGLPRIILQQHNYFGYDQNGDLVQATEADFQFSGARFSSYTHPFVFIDPGAAGETSEVLVHLTIGTKTYNVARYTISFLKDSPEKFTNSGYRSLEYMDENYILVDSIHFDYNTDTATPANNVWHEPLDVSLCQYGFMSPELYDAGYRGYRYDGSKVAQWNEYGFYKMAGNDITSLPDYDWFFDGNLYDRLYYKTGGQQNGYFMYIDAADRPGVVTQLPVTGLCSGTRFYVSLAIASLTVDFPGISYPDINVVFYGVDGSGNQVELHRYTSGDIAPLNNDPDPWRQIYYSFVYTGEIEFDSYFLQVENNCLSTAGGDYAIDEFRIYRSKPPIQIYQIDSPCDRNEPEVVMMVDFDKLLSVMGETEVTTGSGNLLRFKYRVMDEEYNHVHYNYGSEAIPSYEYGEITFSTRFDEMPVLAAGQKPSYPVDGYLVEVFTQDEALAEETRRYLVFLMPNAKQLLNQNVYRSMVSDLAGNFTIHECALISDPIVVYTALSITVDGVPWNEGDSLCYGNNMLWGAKLNDRTGIIFNIEALLDWYFGTVEEFQAPVPGYSHSVLEALELYRSEYPTPAENDPLNTTLQGNYTAEIRDLLQAQVQHHHLILNAKSVDRVIRKNDPIVIKALVETAEVPAGFDTRNLCADLFVVQADGPDKNPTIRLGNENFSNLRAGKADFDTWLNTSNSHFTIAIHDFMNSDGTKSRPLVQTQNRDFYLVQTNDPNYPVYPGTESTFIRMGEVSEVNTTAGYVRFLTTVPTGFEMREGYTYWFEFHFNETRQPSESAVCDGTGRLDVMIVPEYLTWTGDAGDNWNNDNNWRRSVSAELYSPSGYTDDPGGRGFVPLNFCKATLPSMHGTGRPAPWLYAVTGNPLNLDNTNYISDVLKEANAATKLIEYDLVFTPQPPHYSTQSFYANTTSEIYFKPLAEMRSTNYLTYDKAHVEFELASDRWYMLSSPLKNVVAGDMYLPTSSGRQETEAFAPIVYNPTVHNRFDPAVYQRSWDKVGSVVIHPDGSSTDSYLSNTWSHVYNQVNVSYTGATGFSIKAMPGSAGTNSVLFRLPKDDTSYSYYTYNDTPSGNVTSIPRTDNGRLVFENGVSSVSHTLTNQTTGNSVFLVGNPFMATIDMARFFDVNLDLERKYWILTAGGISTAQVAANGNVTSSGDEILDGYIAPMQAFFVQRVDNMNTNTVLFTPDMTVAAGTSSTPGIRSLSAREQRRVSLASGNELRIRALQGGRSSSTLLVNTSGSVNGYDPSEDVELFVDHELQEETPVIYTIAGTQAVMINRFEHLDSIPLGVMSKNEDPVELTFEGLDTFGKDVFLYDNVLNESVSLKNTDVSVRIAGNTHGRYSLRFTQSANTGMEEKPFQVIELANGQVQVTSQTHDPLQRVKVYLLNGMLVKEISTIQHPSVVFDLPGDNVYLLKISSEQHTLTEKIYVHRVLK